MTEVALYSLIALALLVLTICLAGSGRRRHREELVKPLSAVRAATDASFLALADRIFDPLDYHWLRHELSFPEGAEELARRRKELALEWLKSLRNSFQELVRTPEPAAFEGASPSAASSWQLLWLSLRFQFLIHYAILVVRFLGPYHHLIPSFRWVGSLRKLLAAGDARHPVGGSLT
jgi:hypothetical protein